MDRDLPVKSVQKALRNLEFDAAFDGDYFVVRRVKGGPVVFKLWLRRGERDLLRSATVRTLYSYILDIPTDMFYGAVGDIERGGSGTP